LLLVVPFALFGQEQELNVCTQTLNKAQKSYEAGRLSEIPGMLQPCLEKGFERAEKLQALHLMVLAYLFLDQDQNAEATLLRLLKEDPEYKVNEALDPAEFVNLYNRYRTVPIINVGFRAGLNGTYIFPLVPYEVDNRTSTKSKYQSSIGFQFGINTDILIKKNFQLAADLLFTGKKYQYTNVLLDYSKLTFKETQNWLELPIQLKYTFGKQKLRPYVQAGGSVGLLLTSSASVSRVDNISQSNLAVGPDINTKSLRTSINYAALVGGGLRYKIGYGYAVLDVRYAIGLKNATKISNRYSNTDLVYNYGYISDNFLINNLMVSLGYYKSIYKPKKIVTNVE
jgi:hypothetical protein